MSGVRFTSWLSARESAALRTLARENGCSQNFIVRMAVRALLFNAPVPTYLRATDNDNNGGNRDSADAGLSR